MESVGEEKKMQTLFSELRCWDEQTVPAFSGIWSRAQARTLKPRRAFNLSFAIATALLIFALASLALWSRRWDRPAPPARVVATVPPVKSTSAEASALNRESAAVNGVKSAIKPARYFSNELRARLRAARMADQHEASLTIAAKKQATAISSWQSPTAVLLNSSNDNLLKSLPKLNESTDELKSFLPATPK